MSNEAVVEIVAYGSEVHVYEPGDECAEIVYTTAVGANLDAVRAQLTAAQWQTVSDAMGPMIRDHRGQVNEA